MRALLRSFILALMAALAVQAAAQAESAPAQMPSTPLVIGSGAVTGIYFPVAGAIQRMTNDQTPGLRLVVQSTNGSLSNVQALLAGSLDLAVAQSDWAYYAAKGGMPPFTTANTNLRTLLALHAEQLAVVVKKDSGITDINGLKGRKINLGPTGSGPRNIMTALFQSLNWGVGEMGALLDMPFAEQAAALCSGQIDAAVYLVPHPNAAVQDALSKCPTQLVPLSGTAISQLIANNPFYGKTVIAGGTYAGQSADIPSFGVHAVLLATDKLPDSVAYAIAKSAYGSVAQLSALHPALARLTAKDLDPSAYGVMLHAGVAKYLAEAGKPSTSPTPNPAR